MKRFSPALLLLCVLCAVAVSARTRDDAAMAATAAAGAAAAQTEAFRITVEGRPLTGPFSAPRLRGERLLLPLASIARALGDVVQVDATARTVRVLRRSGVKAEFDSPLDLVRENGATVLVLSSTADIDFPPQPEALMLPVEITSALLDASIHLDAAARLVSVRRGQAATVYAGTTRRSGPLELYDAEYDYGLDQYPTGFNHNLTLRADGRLFDGRFAFNSNFGGATGRGFARFNTATFDFERPNGQRLAAGDIGVGGDLVFLSSFVRGVAAQLPFGPTRVNVFAGRSAGGLVEYQPFAEALPQASPTPEPHRSRQTFDTNVVGGFMTFGRAAAGAYHPTALQFSTGVMSFDAPSRRGRLVTGGLRSSSSRYALQADLAAGTFEGLRQEGVAVEGAGAAADISGSFNVRDNLTLQGHYTFNSRNFMTAQAGATPSLNLRSLGVTWRPRRWMTASLTDTSSSRPNRPASAERFTTATFNLSPKRFVSNLFVSHTRYRTAMVPRGSHTLVNASKSFERWHLFANASSFEGSGGSHRQAQVGAHLRVRESDSLQFSQTFGGAGTLAGTFDWSSQSLLSKRVALGAGLGYSRSTSSPFTVYERLNAHVKLPAGQTLQVSYGHFQTGSQLHFSLRGPLFFKRRSRELRDAPASELRKYGSVSGRVYQDINYDGRYEPGVDLPQANVRVRVDGNRSVETDREGVYRIENAPAGEHTVALDLLSVRADLTILGEEARAVTLGAGFDAVVDFRTARTGRVTGTVWLDTNNNGAKEEDEPALADVRVVTSAGRDTLTDESGRFVVADLAPGQHVVLVDIKTLPDNSIVRVPAAGSLQVLVKPGAETGNLLFAVTPRPPERKEF